MKRYLLSCSSICITSVVVFFLSSFIISSGSYFNNMQCVKELKNQNMCLKVILHALRNLTRQNLTNVSYEWSRDFYFAMQGQYGVRLTLIKCGNLWIDCKKTQFSLFTYQCAGTSMPYFGLVSIVDPLLLKLLVDIYHVSTIFFFSSAVEYLFIGQTLSLV